MNELEAFINGTLTFGSLVIALKFLQFWRLSRDSFFLWFVAAFVAFAVSWTLRAFEVVDPDHVHQVYLPRLAAFVFIVAAILQKNRRARRSGE